MNKMSKDDNNRNIIGMKKKDKQLTRNGKVDFHCNDGKWRKATIVDRNHGKIRLKYKRNDNDKGYIGWEDMLNDTNKRRFAPFGAISEQPSMAQCAIGDTVIVWTEDWMSYNREATFGTIKVIQKGQIGVAYHDRYYECNCFGWFFVNHPGSVIRVFEEDDDIKQNDEEKNDKQPKSNLSDKVCIGDWIRISTKLTSSHKVLKNQKGIVKYIGYPFPGKGIRYGIDLNAAKGEHDGSLILDTKTGKPAKPKHLKIKNRTNKRRFFKAKKNHGVFVKAAAITTIYRKMAGIRLTIEDKVEVKYKGIGKIKFIGNLYDTEQRGVWYGIELKHRKGEKNGVKYVQCASQERLTVKQDLLTLIGDEEDDEIAKYETFKYLIIDNLLNMKHSKFDPHNHRYYILQYDPRKQSKRLEVVDKNLMDVVNNRNKSKINGLSKLFEKRIKCGNAICNKFNTNKDFKLCSECQTVYYCSRHCQKYDWNRFNHALICERIGHTDTALNELNGK